MTATAFSVSADRPVAVTVAFGALLTALAAGAAEGLLRAVRGGGEFGATAAGLLPRLAIYLVVAAVALVMLHGSRVARALLTVGIGVVGLLSLIIEPVAVLLSADDYAVLFGELAPSSAVLVGCRTVHILAVLVAIAAMYTPAAHRWFTQR
ncbi:hypothetical protein FEK33_30045 [Nocardia asteroides NBRC 15531]|uniref:Uncharacterized protein n=1 Tax=Nocardia asteroides NBRC 15531 TaxID=1110697 RepID=U5EE06_NOCAS|nr:hypothetical protein [Nocardia asteroides]TLF62245.1 hypothetical protein FEK33_30045 [Nocardia asteroides NBRC 15531]UGT48153.1 hypothetical protein LT345_27340 [Nocardia asteroides]SFN70374.1 hypothetical protein SAMN05444423_11244 [Nocardia asteroides]VEG32887.1 Uncharacterised protein [Nocardia asteroides]GAD84633.1 hypothetical protein NCAST_25_00530 [Nocardia asteroides NBRC 15531]